MGARRSLTGRTDVRLPRGTRRTASATALLLSFALLCTAVSLGGPARRGSHGSPLSPFSARRVSAGAGEVPSRAGIAQHIPSRLADEPRPPHPRVRPRRSVAAIGQESAVTARLLSALPTVFPLAENTVAPSRTSADTPNRFLSYAARTSRTRGHPVSG